LRFGETRKGERGKGKGEKGGWSVGVGRNEIRRWSGVSREQSEDF